VTRPLSNARRPHAPDQLSRRLIVEVNSVNLEVPVAFESRSDSVRVALRVDDLEARVRGEAISGRRGVRSGADGED